jgi:predicted ATPase
MKLTKVLIAGFRSIGAPIELPIDPRVTVLLGSNDHGKSNLLEAIRLLNVDRSLTADDWNWSFDDGGLPADDPPILRIVYHFRLDREEMDWFFTELIEWPEEKLLALGSQATRSALNVDKNGLISGAFADDLFANRTLRIARDAKGLSILVDHVSLAPGSLDPILELVDPLIPRVELFEPTLDLLPDSVSSADMQQGESEFMEGIFYLSGLNPADATLFDQNERTMKRLETASTQLNAKIARRWSQGRDLGLRFQLAHKLNRIELLVDDPAVPTRKVRLSKRSLGVTQFFRMNMILHARQHKSPAHSYIYLFDEPGTNLHPSGQRDLVRVFERFADNCQLLYATHNLFLLNHNFPERHRLVFKDAQGTRIDSKGARANWKHAMTALGVALSPTALLCDRLLFVEGDSDGLYVRELIRQINDLDGASYDLNQLGIVPFGDVQELKYALKRLAPNDAEDTPTTVVLVDGDRAGKDYKSAVERLDQARATVVSLPTGHTGEDLCLSLDAWKNAVRTTLRDAQIEATRHDEIGTALEQLAPNTSGGILKRTFGAKVPVSKVTLARHYVDECRAATNTIAPPSAELVALVRELADALNLPTLRADATVA